MAWNPDQYGRFKAERSRPFFDLLALVRPRAGMRVVDLGCGTGELTAVLHERLQASETLGLDSSAAMLARAPVRPGLRFERGLIEDYGEERRRDLVLANASLHWVADHPALFARLARALDDGGQLAVQLPANHDHASHLVAQEVAREEPFAAALGGYVRHAPLLPVEEYARLLHGIGFADQQVLLRVYPHLLASSAEVVEWVKGSLLTDYEQRMDAALWPRFLERYRARLVGRLDDEQPHLFTFKRIFLWARRQQPAGFRGSGVRGHGGRDGRG